MTATNDPRDEAMLQQLRALRRDQPPGRDLWPDIAVRIAADPSAGRTASARHRVRSIAPWALAASVVLAVLLGWQHTPVQRGHAGTPLVASEARALTREYEAALRVITASAPADSIDSPALRDLDRSSAQIRQALARDPDARFLLDRLQHTYTRRLALTERAALG
jgi:hypothetical protein